MASPKLVIRDGHLGIWGGLREVYPEAGEQRCWDHKIMNVLERLLKEAHGPALRPQAHPLRGVEGRGGAAEGWRRGRVQAARARCGRRDALPGLEAHGRLYGYARAHWQHLGTSKPRGVTIRGPEAQNRSSQAVQEGGAGDGDDLEAPPGREQHSRRLEGAEWLPSVARGTRFMDGRLAEELVVEEIAA